MAASTATVALSSSIVAVPSSFSSRTSFAPQVVNVAPCKSTVSRRSGVVAVRASASEEPRSVRKEILAGLVAAGAALAVAGSSMIDVGTAIAASGPGNDGAAITAKQADDLLKAGDDFTNNDSPQRFGGERVGPLAQRNSGKVAQQAGSGAVDGLQNNFDAGSKAIETAKENVEKTGKRLGDLFQGNNNSSGDMSSADALGDAADNVKGGVQDLLNNGPEKVKADVDTASQKVRNDVATTKDAVQRDSKSGVASSQGAAEKAQNTAGNAVEEGKGFFADLKNKITDAIPN